MNAAHVESGSDGSQHEANLKAKDDAYVEEKQDENTDATAGTFAYGIDPAHQKKVMYVPLTRTLIRFRTTTDSFSVGRLIFDSFQFLV